MAAVLATLPGWGDPALTPGGTSLEQNYFAFLKSIVAVIAERDATIAAQAQHIETLRVALNEVRQNPTTVYPAIPAF